jgi:uncharacterized protein YndB with AHSA1/START domain
MGVVLREGGRLGLRFERRLAHPQDKVWRALTDSAELRHWLPTDIVGERATGAAIELPFWPDHAERYGIAKPVLRGTIRSWDPPRLFEWTWDTDILRWELRPDGDGTILVFTTWLADPETSAAVSVAAGLHVCLDQLQELLDAGDVQHALIERDTRPWEGTLRASGGRPDVIVPGPHATALRSPIPSAHFR